MKEVFGTEELSKTLEEFTVSRQWLNGVSVEVEGGLNDVDSLTLLRSYEAEPTVDSKLVLANAFCRNHAVRFIDTNENRILKEVVCPATGFSKHFDEEPWLLQVLLGAAYGWMVKKLTPPSVSSTTDAAR